MNNSDRLPVLFIGHGSPMNAVEDNEFNRAWVSLGNSLPRPRAVLCISAHWETSGPRVTVMQHPRTIHDFSGFPKELYDIRYPVPGSPEVARETADVVTEAEIVFDDQWGLDHGCWSVLKSLFPNADVPVVQFSLDHYRSPQQHYDLAKNLSSLRKKGILIIGSGNMVHNLGRVAWDKMNEPEYGYDWALEARSGMKELIFNGDHNRLIGYHQQGEAFKLAIPTAEHFLPLLYVLALQENGEEVTLFSDKVVMGSVAMTSLVIGNI